MQYQLILCSNLLIEMELNNCGIKWYFESKLMFLSTRLIGVSMGRSGSSLCPTHNRPDGIGFLARKQAADRKNQWVRMNQICLISGQISRSRRRCCEGSFACRLNLWNEIFVYYELSIKNDGSKKKYSK